MTRFGLTIRAEGVKRRYGQRVVLDVESFEAKAGETVAILGPSGAGKTTLLSILGLLEGADEGTVYLDGKKVTVRDKTARRRMAAAFQSPFLFKGTVGENVEYGLKLRGVKRRERRSAATNVLERVGLWGFERRGVNTLSGGEAQRVSLARALVLRPSVLFLDEPLASLDPLAKGSLSDDIARIIREDSITTIYVTHDQSEALAMASKVAVLRDGRVVAEGGVFEVMGLPPDTWTADFLGSGAPLEGVVVESTSDLMGVDVGGPVIWAAGNLPKGRAVLVGVRPEDVLLFDGEVDLPRSTARNRFSAKIVDVRMWGVMRHIVLDIEGAVFASRVSHFSAREMDLSVGKVVQVLFKATAVRVRESMPRLDSRNDAIVAAKLAPIGAAD